MIYLTHHNFKDCAKNLHTKELFEQIAYICNLITKDVGDEKDLDLWRFNERKLAAYWIYSIKEYMKRDGVPKEQKKQLQEAIEGISEMEVNPVIPDFMEENHVWSKHLLMSHRVFLLRKRPKFYKHIYPKLFKNLSKYPTELFYMVTRYEKECMEANDKWKAVMPVPQSFAAFENGKDVTQKYLALPEGKN